MLRETSVPDLFHLVKTDEGRLFFVIYMVMQAYHQIWLEEVESIIHQCKSGAFTSEFARPSISFK